MTSVSIAMATYNGQRYIRRQLESLAAQSHLPAELVITDDASTDETLKVAEAFAKTAPFQVRIHANENRLGYRKNFMRAASLCGSELIAFCDQDDYWYPHKIAASVKPFGDPEVLLTYHNADIVTESGAQIGSLAKFAPQKPILAPLSSGPWLYALGFTQVFRQSLIPLSYLWPKTLDPNDEGQPLAQDQWFFLLASVLGKIAYLDEPLVAYVQHENNLYGWRKDSFAVKMRRDLGDRSVECERLARAAESRAEILEIAKSDLEGIHAKRAAAASDYYRMVARLYATRRTLYESPNFSDRFNAFRAIFAKNGYAAIWGVGYKRLLLDLGTGVLQIGHPVRSLKKRFFSHWTRSG